MWLPLLTNEPTSLLLRSLSNDDGDGNENGNKSNRFRLARQQLCTCITLFCTSLGRRYTTATWECLISRFVEDVNKANKVSFSFPELWYRPLKFTLKKSANIWRIKRDGISEIKFEVARLHFLSRTFSAVVVALAPYWSRLDCWNTRLKHLFLEGSKTYFEIKIVMKLETVKLMLDTYFIKE